MNAYYLFYGSGEPSANTFETFPESTREWRNDMLQHFDEKIDEAVEAINTNTDTRATEIHQYHVDTVMPKLDAIKQKTDEIKGVVDSIDNKVPNSLSADIADIKTKVAEIYNRS